MSMEISEDTRVSRPIVGVPGALIWAPYQNLPLFVTYELTVAYDALYLSIPENVGETVGSSSIKRLQMLLQT